jgi:hypothetical protein
MEIITHTTARVNVHLNDIIRDYSSHIMGRIEADMNDDEVPKEDLADALRNLAYDIDALTKNPRRVLRQKDNDVMSIFINTSPELTDIKADLIEFRIRCKGDLIGYERGVPADEVLLTVLN